MSAFPSQAPSHCAAWAARDLLHTACQQARVTGKRAQRKNSGYAADHDTLRAILIECAPCGGPDPAHLSKIQSYHESREERRRGYKRSIVAVAADAELLAHSHGMPCCSDRDPLTSRVPPGI